MHHHHPTQAGHSLSIEVICVSQSNCFYSRRWTPGFSPPHLSAGVLRTLSVSGVSASTTSEFSLRVLHNMIWRRCVRGIWVVRSSGTVASFLLAHHVTSTFTSDRHWARWPSHSIWVNLAGQEQGEPLKLSHTLIQPDAKSVSIFH